jgi:dGTPase
MVSKNYGWEDRIIDSKKRFNEVRTEWERDYARIIHSSAFRRLQAKTQVLGLGESDFYRTRLTHSMEVAQIGTGIVRFLREKYKEDGEKIKMLPDDFLMNAICLAHDLGHPPFGHGGEVALNICMRDYGGFEGNGQTLRILSKLEKYTEKNGINPTRRLLLGVLKYPIPYSDAVNEKAYDKLEIPKWLSKAKPQKPPKCYLDDEKEVVNWILQNLEPEEKQEFTEFKTIENKHFKPKFKSLDTSIMELADDISYSLHDLEDSISLRLITLDDWNSHYENLVECEKNKKEEDDISKEALNRSLAATKLNLQSIGANLFSGTSYERKDQIGDLVNRFITSVILDSSGMKNATCELLKWNAKLDENHRVVLDFIFKLVVNKVIKSSNVQQLEFKGQKIVIELFQALDSDPLRLLPTSTLERYNKIKDEDVDCEDKRKRVICDYIAGMTDDYATRLYEKIYHPHKGSIFDRL